MASQAIFLAIVFIAVLAIGLTVTRFFTPDATAERLRQLGGGRSAIEAPRGAWIEKIVALTGPLGRLSLPEEGCRKSRRCASGS